MTSKGAFKHADPPHSLGLLRPHRKRPCRCCAADDGDEFPPSHGDQFRVGDRINLAIFYGPAFGSTSGFGTKPKCRERRAFPVLGVKPTSRVLGATAAFDPGCVKTRLVSGVSGDPWDCAARAANSAESVRADA